ncbi:MAG: LamG domain-containing protein, partial [Dehalococcoidales bacterium]|nr:LamG domain-containing protein [Dehalococcoidales bacterium]
TGSTTLEKTFTVSSTSPDYILNFKWMLHNDETAGSDRTLVVNVYQDGNLYATQSLSGFDSWTSASAIRLVHGEIDHTYTVDWVYSDSGTSQDAANTAWVDEVTIAPPAEAFEYPAGSILPLPVEYINDASHPWVNQNTVSFDDGGFAAQASDVSGGTTTLKRDITINATDPDAILSFNWMLHNDETAGSDRTLVVNVYQDGNLYATQSLSSFDAWISSSPITLAAGHTYNVQWLYADTGTSNDPANTAWIDTVTVTPVTSNTAFDYFGAPAPIPAEYTNDATNPWVNQDAVAYDTGGCAIQAGAVYDSNTSSITRTVDLTAAGADATLNFAWKTSTGNKQLKVEVRDGSGNLVSEESIGGGADWAQNTPIVLAKGSIYTITWTYTNSDPVSGDTDTAWIDNINIQGRIYMDFQGSNDYVGVNNIAVGSNWTMGAWFNFPPPEATGGWNTLFRGTSYHHIIIQRSNMHLGLYKSGFKDSGFDMSTLSSGWHYVTAVGSGGNSTTFYIDGVQAGNVVAYEATDNLTSIGNYSGGGQQFGAIDEVAIYNRVLTQEEVQALMANGPTENTNGLLAYYSFEDGTAADNSGNGYNGTIYGSPSPMDPVGITPRVETFSHPSGWTTSLPAGYTTDSANPWTDQNTVSYDADGFAAQAGSVYGTGENDYSYIEKGNLDLTTATTDSILNFNYNIYNADGQTDRALSVVVAQEGGSTTTYTLGTAGSWQAADTITLAKGFVYTIKWVYRKDSNGGDAGKTAWVDNIVITPVFSVTTFNYTTGMTIPIPAGYMNDTVNPWVNQNTTAYDANGFALQAPDISGATSTFGRDVTIDAADSDALLNFKWMLQDDGSGRSLTLNVYQDGNLYATQSISSYDTWVAASSITLTAGHAYSIQWVYADTDTSANHTQTAWVDEVSVAPVAIPIAFEYPVGTTIPIPAVYMNDTVNPWVNQNTTAYDTNGFALQAADVSGTTTTLGRDITINATDTDAVLSFRWRLHNDETTGSDRTLVVNVYQDGNFVTPYATQSISAFDAWTSSLPIALAAGHTYNIRWVYGDAGTSKDATSTAWVDNIVVATEGTFDYPAGTAVPIPAEYANDATNPWINQNVVAYDEGGFAAQVADVSNGTETTLERVVTIDATDVNPYYLLNFKWMLHDDGSGRSFKVNVYQDGNFAATYATQTLSGFDAWSSAAVTLVSGHTYNIRWVYSDADASTDAANTAWLAKVTVDAPGAFDYPAGMTAPIPAEYTNDTANPWINQATMAYEVNGFAVKAADVSNGSQTTLERVVTINAEDPSSILNFKWMLHDDGSGRSLTVNVYQDDDFTTPYATQSISSFDTWSSAASVILTSGHTYTIRWVYSDADASTDAVNTAWVANVNIASKAYLNFNGSNNYVRVSNNTALNPSTITMSAWIKTSTKDSTWRRIIDKAYNNGYVLCMVGDSSGKVSVQINGKSVNGTTNVADNNWHFVTGTYDGSNIRIYVDGALQGTYAYTGTITSNAYDLAIGINQSTSAGSEAFKGNIDEVSIYNRALSQTEIQALMANRPTSNPDGLVAYYSFDDGTAIDNSGNGYDGTVNGASAALDRMIYDDFKPNPFKPLNPL